MRAATNAQRYPAGRFVVAWQSNGQDGATNGVFAQRLTLASAVPQRQALMRLLSCAMDSSGSDALADRG